MQCHPAGLLTFSKNSLLVKPELSGDRGNWPVSSVVETLISVREVWGSNPRSVKSWTQCRQRLDTHAMFLMSCVAQA